MQTIILFLIYFALTAFLQFWFSIPKEVKRHADIVLDAVISIESQDFKAKVCEVFYSAKTESELSESLQSIIANKINTQRMREANENS